MRFLIFIIVCYGTASILTAQQGEDPSIVTRAIGRGDRAEGRRCRHRRTPGFCKRRSECNQPTRRVCRVGPDPVVCCLDKSEEDSIPGVIFPQESPQQPPRPTTTRKPPRPPRTTKKPSIIFPQETPAPPKPSRPQRVNPQPPKSSPQKVADLTFPGCGSRSPTIPDSNARTGANRERSSRRRGFSWRVKREISASHDEGLHIDEPEVKKRCKRQWRSGMRPVVVGGFISKPNSWPWMTAIFKKSSTGTTSRFLCGASLISRRYVISAAHCFDSEQGNLNPSKFSVSVGAHNTRDGTEYPLESIKIHPKYQQRQYYNDLSILKTTKPVELTRRVYPVCMPQPTILGRIVTHQNVTVTGWGDTSFGGVASKVLREVSFPVVPLRQCNASYAKTAGSTFPRGITEEFICAGVQEGGKDACQGDSGGPLVMNTVEDKWVQVGVVSFGYGCAQPGFPGVYTRVEKYTRWIYENSDLGRQ